MAVWKPFLYRVTQTAGGMSWIHVGVPYYVDNATGTVKKDIPCLNSLVN